MTTVDVDFNFNDGDILPTENSNFLADVPFSVQEMFDKKAAPERPTPASHQVMVNYRYKMICGIMKFLLILHLQKINPYGLIGGIMKDLPFLHLHQQNNPYGLIRGIMVTYQTF